MADAASVLSANGILRASEVVELAAACGLDLACAAVMLDKESGGGRNVWGSDGVVIAANTYVKGSTVTQAAYLAYRTAVRAGRAGRQGCGPTQLTYGPFQDQADQAGGCWDWRANVRTGFMILANNIRAGGIRTGFRAYNGSGAAAERYADDAMNRLARWRTRLAGADPTPEDTVIIQSGSWSPGDDEHQTLSCPVGPAFAAKTGWFSLGVGWADATVKVTFIGARKSDGTRTYLGGDAAPVTLPYDARRPSQIPAGTELISVDYSSDNPIGWSLELFTS
jgi:hypothetical protein